MKHAIKEFVWWFTIGFALAVIFLRLSGITA